MCSSTPALCVVRGADAHTTASGSITENAAKYQSFRKRVDLNPELHKLAINTTFL